MVVGIKKEGTTTLDFEAAARVLGALSHPTRLAIVRTLVTDNVGLSGADISDMLGISQKVIGEHLRLLHRVSIVERTERSSVTLNKLNENPERELCSFLREQLVPEPQPNQDADSG